MWNTFLGPVDDDWGWHIDTDGSGNVYVIGQSDATWGSPVNSHSGGVFATFVAKLDSNGNLLWNTFLGSEPSDQGYGIVPDGSGNVYVIGFSDGGWGAPVNPYREEYDIFVARLGYAQSYSVSAWVSGGHGSVSPGNQTVQAGEAAEIRITPDPGYRIFSIMDNGNPMPVSNPYIIYNLDRNHDVAVAFAPDLYPPVINLAAVSKTEQVWIIKKDYGEVSISIVEHATHPLEVARYILYRIEDGSMTQLAEYTAPGSYFFLDKFLESGMPYGYRVMAVDAAGTVVAQSDAGAI